MLAIFPSSTKAEPPVFRTAEGWGVETVDGDGYFGSYLGRFTSIALDANGKVHISYLDDTDYDLKYATNVNGHWETTFVDTSGYKGFGSSIALDSKGHAYIAYSDGTNNRLKYATNAGGSWVNTTVEYAVVTDSISLALDSNDKAHISFYKMGSNDLKYATNAGGSWASTTVDSEGDVGLYSSIAIDSADKAHISYHDVSLGYLKYATNGGGSWSTQILEIGGRGSYSAIDLDSNDKVHISYYDATTGDLRYTNNMQGGWTFTPLDTVGDVGQFTSIALDDGNGVHISYLNVTGYDLTYIANTAGSWVKTTIDSYGFVGADNDLAVDAEGKVHISYYDGTNADLKYATNDVWYKEIASEEGVVGHYPSLALDPNGKVHISHHDLIDQDLEYSTNAGGSWVTTTVDYVGQVGMYTSIAISSTGIIWISYFDMGGGDLKVAYNGGGVWDHSTVDSGGTVGPFSAIAISPNGMPHISYHDATNGHLKYATYSGGWDITTVDDADSVGFYTSIAVDQAGYAHISYFDDTNMDLKYATNAGGSWSVSTVDSEGTVGGRTDIALDSVGKAHISYYDATNDDLKYATNAGGSWSTYTVDSVGDVGSYTSIAVDHRDKVHISYYEYDHWDLKYANNVNGVWMLSTVQSGDVGQVTAMAVDANGKAHICYNDAVNDDLVYVTNAPWGLRGLANTGQYQYYTSLAVDSNYKVHISYYDATNSDLKYATNSGGAWAFSTVDSTGTVGRYNAIALDGNGKVHISYFDDGAQNLKYATNAGGSWTSTTVDADLDDVGRDTSIAIDSGGKVHIAYYDLSNNWLKYTNNSGGSWSFITLDDSGDVEGDMSIGIDSNDKVHISFVGGSSDNRLMYITNAGGSWSASTLDDSALYTYSTSLALDADDKVHISYQEAIGMDLKYATNAGGTWSFITVDSPGDVGEQSSLVVDQEGVVHISYLDSSNDDLKYATKKMGTWVSTTVDSKGDVGLDPSIDLDPSGKLHIAYLDYTNSKLKYANELSEPSAPRNLVGTPSDTPAIELTWSAPLTDHGFQVSGYRIYRGTSPSNEVLIATVGNVLSYSDPFTENGTFYYRVAAVNAVGVGIMSAEEDVAITITPPGAPNLSGYAYDEYVTLWFSLGPLDYGGARPLYYNVYQSNDTPDGPYHLVYQPYWSPASLGGLTNGFSYYFKVSAVSLAGEGALSNYYQLRPVGPPYAPQNLTATPYADNITLHWDPPISWGGGMLSTTNIFRGTTTENMVFLDYVNNIYLSYVDTDVVPGQTYYYYVLTTSDHGPGDPSNVANATIYNPPGAPTDLQAVPLNGQVSLVWLAPGSDGGSPIDYYIVYRDGEDIGHPEYASFDDTGLSNGGTYTYTVAAHNAIGTGPESDPVQATPLTVPGAPTNLQAFPGNEQVYLTWDPPSDDGGESINYYLIYRDWVYIGPSMTLNYTDLWLTNGVTYTYRIAAVNDAGDGPLSSSVEATPSALPDAPTGLQVLPGSGQVSLTWTAPVETGGSPIDYYIVYRNGMDIWHPTGTGYLDSGLMNGVTYTYTVAAHTSAGTGPPSSPVQATPFTIPTAPLDLEGYSGDTAIGISWSPPASNGGSPITDYNVYRGTVSGGEVYVGHTDSGSIYGYYDTGLSNGVTYYYKVTAVNAAGESPYSSEVSFVPAGLPSAPQNLQAVPGNGNVTVTWDPPISDGGSDIINFNLERRPVGGSITLLHLGPVNYYLDTGLTNGVTYEYRISALNSVGESPMTDWLQVTPITVPGAPQNLIDTPGNGNVALSWSAPSSNGGASIDHYIVYRNGTDVGHPVSLSFTDTGLSNGVTYTYTVAAHNAAGPGPQSSSVQSVPRTVPGAPTDLEVTPGNAQVALAWSAPNSNGGSAIDYYVVYRDGSDVGHPTVTSFTDTGRTNGVTYVYTVAAHNAAGIGAQSSSEEATPLTVPGAPTDLQATPGNAQVILSWSAPSSNGGSVIDYYIVYRDGSDVKHTTAFSFVDTGLTNGVTYTYTVAAHNAAGIGPQSSSRQAKPITVPGAPTGLAATPGNNQVSLTWLAPSSNGGSVIDYYIVYRDDVEMAHVASLSHVDNNVLNGVSYTYAIAAHNAAGNGAKSSTVQTTPRTVPDAPTDLLATPGNAQVDLTWNAPADDGGADIDHYLVYRNGIDVGHPTALSFVDSSLTNGATYTYTVAAHNVAGYGPASSPIDATPFTVPGVPTDLQATPGDSFVNLTWSAPDFDGGRDILSYQIWRGATSGSETYWTQVTSLWYNDTGLVNEQTYYYLVKAVNTAGPGASSSEVFAEPSPDIFPPSAPLNLQTVAGDEQITLSWDPPGNNGGSPVTAYKVYRGLAPGEGALLLTLGNEESHLDTELENGLRYYYAISAVNVAGEGPLSTEVSAIPVAVPGAPSGLQAIVGDAQVSLSWTAPDDNGADIDHYVVYRNGEDVSHPTVTNYLDAGLDNGATYHYMVAAHNAVGLGPLSSTVQAMPFTIPGAPTGLEAVPGNAQVELSWNAPGSDGGVDIDHYVVFVDGVDVIHTSLLTFTVVGLTNGVEYDFTVAAHNTAGNGVPSSMVQATPFTVPGAPTDLLASVNVTQVQLTWSAPADDGGADIHHYIVYRDGEDFVHTTGTSYSYLEFDMGTHTFAVAALNSAGIGDLSSLVEVDISQNPSQPLALQATPGNEEVQLTWSAPAAPGIGTLTYHLFRDGTEVWSGVETSYLDTGLVKGALHVYSVAASNSFGWSVNCTAVETTALGVPNSPTDLSATAGDGTVALDWDAPSYAGPGALTYHLFRNGLEIWNGTATSYQDTGLENGQEYAYKVAASNSIGWSGNSTAISATPIADDSDDEGSDLTLIVIIAIVAVLVVAVGALWYLKVGRK
ncbi:MAG: fibronectin type III domain-containing protein [Methanomassiliicoccales archaeon]